MNDKTGTKITRRQILKAGVVLSVGWLAAACGQSTAPSQQGQTGAPSNTTTPSQQSQASAPTTSAPAQVGQKIPLRVYLWASNPDDVKAWQAQLDLAVKNQPQLQPTLETDPFAQYNQKLVTMAAGGTLPDVVFLNGPLVASFVARGVTRSLQPFIDKDKYDLSDFVPTALEQGRFRGEIQTLFYDYGALMGVYNVDMFDKAGVPHPDASWSWDELLTHLKTLTKRDASGRLVQAGTYLNNVFERGLLSFIWQNGGEPWDSQAKEALIDSDASVQAIQWYADLRNVQKVTATDMGNNNDARNQVLAGTVAYFWDGPWTGLAMNAKKDLNWDYGLLFHQKNDKRFASGSGYAMGKNTKNPDAAWLLIKELASKDSLDVLGRAQRAFPARFSSMDSYFTNTRPKHISYAKAEVVKGQAPTPLTTYQEMNDLLNRELADVLLGQAQAKDVVPKLKPQMNDLLAKHHQIMGS